MSSPIDASKERSREGLSKSEHFAGSGGHADGVRRRVHINWIFVPSATFNVILSYKEYGPVAAGAVCAVGVTVALVFNRKWEAASPEQHARYYEKVRRRGAVPDWLFVGVVALFIGLVAYIAFAWPR